MGKRRSKNHHYIPKIIQKAFRSNLDGEPYIWHSKKKDGKFSPPSEKPTEKTFVIRNFYSVLDENDELSDVVERKFYGEIDAYWGALLPEIFEIFDRGSNPLFEGQKKQDLIYVVHEMLKRTPDFTRQDDEVETGTEILKNAIASCGDDPNFAEEKKNLQSDLNHPEYLRNLGRDLRVRSIIEPSKRVLDILQEFSIRWVMSGSKHSFLLPGQGIYRIGNGGGNGLINPDVEFWFPISPKIILVLVRDKDNRIPTCVVEDPTTIRKINKFAIATSDEVGSHSKLLIESLLRQRARPHVESSK